MVGYNNFFWVTYTQKNILCYFLNQQVKNLYDMARERKNSVFIDIKKAEKLKLVFIQSRRGSYEQNWYPANKYVRTFVIIKSEM